MKRKQRSSTPKSMAPKTNTNTLTSLPLKTIEDVLSRLPTKSLARFESLSKRCLSIIRSPKFISAHLSHSSSRTPSLLIRRFHNPTGSNFTLCLITKHPHGADSNSISHREIKIPFFGSLFRFPIIIASCDGLLCLDISLAFSSDFVLWNVSTGQFRALPKPVIIEEAQSRFWMVASGFGYNSVVDDYKVVRIVAFRGVFPIIRAEVFDLNVGSWRLIDQGVVGEGFDSCVISQGQQAVNVDGALHWIANGIGKLSDRTFIVSFDLATDNFVRSQTPNISADICMKLMRFKDSVALALYPALPFFPGYGMNSDRMELWVLDDYGLDGKKWIKVHSISSVFSQPAIPIEILNDAELLIKRVENEVVSLSFYNPTNQSLKRLPICSYEFSCQVYSYVDSLVPVFAENKDVMEAN